MAILNFQTSGGGSDGQLAPEDVTALLPSISSTANAGKGCSYRAGLCSNPGSDDIWPPSVPSWLCSLHTWINENRVMAGVLAVGVYFGVKGKKR